MILFFIMALVAAYTNRNLVFEQRISANSYRAARAMESSDSAIEWALVMLNGGRVDDNCVASDSAGQPDFRQRYLAETTSATGIDGTYARIATGVAAPAHVLLPACINVGGNLRCICPTPANPNPAIGAPGDGIGSAFKLGVVSAFVKDQPGVVQILVRGCSNPGAANTGCYAQITAPPVVDTVSGALTTFGLVRALPVPPTAALTTGRNIVVTAGVLSIENNGSTPLKAHAGGTITPPTDTNEGFVTDNSLSTLRGTDPSLAWFNALFGMPVADYKRQPAVVTCAAGCTGANLVAILAGHPHNPIWVEGDLDISTAASLGSATDPMMLIVAGTLTLSADAQLVGFVHANNIVWNAAGAAMQGAMVAATNFTSSTNASLSYNKPVLDIIRLRYGSFVRVPGSWNQTDIFAFPD